MEITTPDTILQGRYKIISQLGRGGMGAVHLATDLRFGSTVALKQTLMSGDELARAFEREAQLLNKLRHAALPVVSDYFVEDDGQFLVMQFIPGDDLSTLLARDQQPFDVATVMQWADQLLAALEYLHTHEPPVIHRDIKPQNLKLTPRGEIILLDFGLSKLTAIQTPNPETRTDSRAATSLSVVGYTPHYAPFEQITGAGTDGRSDLFSLAATLYHLLTNTLPPDALRRASCTMDGQPDPLLPAHELNPLVPLAVSDALHSALKLNRELRPSNADEFRQMLRAAKQLPQANGNAATIVSSAQGSTQTSLAPQTTTTESKNVRSWRLPLVGGAGTLAIALSSVFLWSSSNRVTPNATATNTAINTLDKTETSKRTSIAPPEATFKYQTVTLSPNGTIKERPTLQGRYFSEDLSNGVSLEMVSIPAGNFLMGTEDTEKEYPDETPQHEVTLKPFYIGKFEVTQAQWRAVAKLPKVKIDLNPDPSGFKGDDLPVEDVSWDDAVEFCARLSNKAGRSYRLPSEAEWEYAARAGTKTRFAFGDTITSEIANFDGTSPFGSAAPGVFRQKTVPVGSLGVANAFGLYDMYGNVWEWCGGEYHDSYRGAPTDGSAWVTSGDVRQRVRRGGAWDNLGVDLRSANRYSYAPEGKRRTIGFRVAMSL